MAKPYKQYTLILKEKGNEWTIHHLDKVKGEEELIESAGTIATIFEVSLWLEIQKLKKIVLAYEKEYGILKSS